MAFGVVFCALSALSALLYLLAGAETDIGKEDDSRGLVRRKVFNFFKNSSRSRSLCVQFKSFFVAFYVSWFFLSFTVLQLSALALDRLPSAVCVCVLQFRDPSWEICESTRFFLCFSSSHREENDQSGESSARRFTCADFIIQDLIHTQQV